VVDFYIRRGDRSQPFQRTLRKADGTAQDLTTRTVKFFMTNRHTGEVVVDGVEITPVDAANGVVQYEWEEGTTDVAGSYWGVFQTIDTEGRPGTFPNVGYLEIEISKKASDP
jgi:hypothetical protein